jgi:hypothetical protein
MQNLDILIHPCLKDNGMLSSYHASGQGLKKWRPLNHSGIHEVFQHVLHQLLSYHEGEYLIYLHFWQHNGPGDIQMNSPL